MPKDVGLEEMRRLVGEHAQVVEVLPRPEYDAEHLTGAVSIPLKTLDEATSSTRVALSSSIAGTPSET